METGQLATASFYERIGGGPALQLAVGEFYELVLADEELKGFFAETDLAQLKKHQAALLASVLGGPSAYAGRDMVDAHAGLGITERQFLLVRDYLLSVLWKLHVPVDIIDAVTSTVLSLKGSIVTA
ncbi:group 1 truncated hemoglobin [Actinospica sp. MGRD01-02]|uniref:Group 1 truncated hemoglobin n=1 Tax=Actinospica acidithermotolerans TaxID=2828514 RepID=A0A941IIP8_9ACTN|nr:group 1 truncated hemoglobin [Actinospica acidithermotolerans]MBR7828569.1 group 1 truncated hemoglobin [Actinospica acidithermotolerans]